MKRIIAAICLVVALLALSLVGCSGDKYYELPGEATLENALKDGGYVLDFEDNFDGDKLDTVHWNVGYPDPYRRGGYYADDAVFVKDGKLVIRTDYRENGEHGAGWYTGWVESASPNGGHNKTGRTPDYEGYQTTYGYLEVRAKAPKTYGVWSAFWLMPDDGLGAEGMLGKDELGTGKDGVEVDIMESLFYGNKKERELVQHVIHGDGYGETMKNDASDKFKVPHMYDEFHDYGVMWTDAEYIFYIDGRETYRTPYKAGDMVLGVAEAPAYMLLTVEIAGTSRDGKVYPGKDFGEGGKLVEHWAGNPNNNKKSNVYDFEVDRVRVYKKGA